MKKTPNKSMHLALVGAVSGSVFLLCGLSWSLPLLAICLIWLAEIAFVWLIQKWYGKVGLLTLAAASFLVPIFIICNGSGIVAADVNLSSLIALLSFSGPAVSCLCLLKLRNSFVFCLRF